MDLDRLLTQEQCAMWLQISPNTLGAKSMGKRAAIPAAHITSKIVRYHPRTILAKFAADAGVPFEVIAAGFTQPEKPHESQHTPRSLAFSATTDGAPDSKTIQQTE